eukprot:1554918-Lingulodinium_polyedra.AAC.1
MRLNGGDVHREHGELARPRVLSLAQPQAAKGHRSEHEHGSQHAAPCQAHQSTQAACSLGGERERA